MEKTNSMRQSHIFQNSKTQPKLEKLASKREASSSLNMRKISVKIPPSSTNKLKWSMSPTAPRSSSKDEVDEIYKEKDPIASSLVKRKSKGGLVTSVVQDNKLKNIFYFSMRLKGTMPEFKSPEVPILQKYISTMRSPR